MDGHQMCGVHIWIGNDDEKMYEGGEKKNRQCEPERPSASVV